MLHNKITPNTTSPIEDRICLQQKSRDEQPAGQTPVPTEDEEVYLCYCNNCEKYLIDNNPQSDAKKYDSSIAEGELKLFPEPPSDTVTDDVTYFRGCPYCETDNYLTDI